MSVGMMCARSVTRSNSALHNRVLVNTCVHSENGKFVVMMIAAFSARSLIVEFHDIVHKKVPRHG